MRGLSQRSSVADVARHRPPIWRNSLINLINAGRRMTIGEREDDWSGMAIAGSDTCILKSYLFSTAASIIGLPRSRADQIGLPLSREG
jgi:hypothetical protein